RLHRRRLCPCKMSKTLTPDASLVVTKHILFRIINDLSFWHKKCSLTCAGRLHQHNFTGAHLMNRIKKRIGIATLLLIGLGAAGAASANTIPMGWTCQGNCGPSAADGV